LTLLIQGDRHQRSVLNFTFRDSIKDFINIAYWLPPKDLIIISSKFTTGDVGMKRILMELKNTFFFLVAIHYPVVKPKLNDKANSYTPWTPLYVIIF